MNEQQMREIAAAAFKRHFSDIELVRVNVRQTLDFGGDPVVDVNIIYDDETGELTGEGYCRVMSEVHDKTWLAGKDDLGYPLVHILAKSGLEGRDPATA